MSWRQRFVSSRRSAAGSPFTYLSNQAVVYHVIRSAPRSVAPNAGFGMNEKSRCEPPRMTSSPLSMPCLEYSSEASDLQPKPSFLLGWTPCSYCASTAAQCAGEGGSEVFGVGGRK